MTAKDLDETLATIAKQAKALREAGVTGRVSVGLISFELASAEPAQSIPVVAAEAPDESGNALDDPDTYPGGFIPTRKRRDVPRAMDDSED